jgi:hypothetical protein
LELGQVGCRGRWRIVSDIGLWLGRPKNRGNIDTRALASLKVRDLETGEKIRDIRRAKQRQCTGSAIVVNSKTEEGSTFRINFNVEKFRKAGSELTEVVNIFIAH